MTVDLDAVFKAYDVRGLVPLQLDASMCRLIGRAFVAEVDASTVVVGRDMRASSPELAGAFAEGVRDAGASVVDIGLASTDELYFASGHLDLPAAMFTASHNPAGYNGIKTCRAGAVALSRDTGLARIRDQVAAWLVAPPAAPTTRGGYEQRDVLDAYAGHLRSLVPVSGRALTVVVDAGNGMAGHTVPAVLGGVDLDVVPLYFELDGTFPHHEANPLDPATLVDLQAAVREHGADLGLAFDGDADRCFVVDERGEVVPPSAITALIAVRELAREPGAPVVHNLISSRAVRETIVEHGGVPVRTPVGHSLIKATMADQDAVFGGEHSGHFYFRDFWFADSGMLAALHVLGALAAADGPVSQLFAPYDPYVASGEINTTVSDQEAVVAAILLAWSDRDDVTSTDRLDGLTVTGDRWWFNVRASNTEPLLRLNVEADDRTTMETVRDEVLGLMRSDT